MLEAGVKGGDNSSFIVILERASIWHYEYKNMCESEINLGASQETIFHADLNFHYSL